MKPILIPKQQHQNDDLVILPKKEYERLVQRAAKPESTTLEKDIEQSMKEFKQGKMSGPFASVDELMKSLEA